MSRVVIEAVRKVFPGHSARDEPVVALEDVSFRVADREFCSILGHSGCGKTTLLMLLAGFEQPTEGSIRVNDVAQKLQDSARPRRALGQ